MFSTIFLSNPSRRLAHGFETCIPVFGRKIAFVFQDHGQAFVECRVAWCYAGEAIYQAVVEAEEGGYEYGIVYFAIGGVVGFCFLYHGRCYIPAADANGAGYRQERFHFGGYGRVGDVVFNLFSGFAFAEENIGCCSVGSCAEAVFVSV